MFKKTVALAVCMALMGQNLLFAQQHPVTNPLPLATAQQQAINAIDYLAGNEYFPVVLIVSEAVTLSLVGVLIYKYIKNDDKLKQFTKDYNKLSSQNKELKQLLADSKALAEALQEISHKEMGKRLMYQSQIAVNPSLRAHYLEEQFRFILNHPDNKLVEEILEILYNNGYFGVINQAEYEQLQIWINKIKRTPKVNGKVSPKFAENFVKRLPVQKLKKSDFPKIMEKAFKRSNLAPALLLLTSVGLLASNASAQAQDTSMMQRIAENPGLFLSATPEEIALIEQDPLANQFCREWTQGLVALANMTPQEREELVSIAKDMQQQERAQEVSKRDLVKHLSSLRSLTAH